MREVSASPPQLVNSWNEWDPLQEIVVGSADHAAYEPTEPGHRPQVRARPGQPAPPFPSGPKPLDTIERANHELEGLVALLESRGIVVRRPDPYEFSRPLRTPTFEVDSQYCATCPRDVLITIGNEIIEATMSRRARYFEHLCYRRLVQGYWSEDPNARWTVAPKPTMADSMYRTEFWEWSMSQRYEAMHSFEFCISQDEVVFDAADIARLGRDILVQESMTTNRAGIRWLARHLEPRGLRVHPVHFPLDRFPSHIDCTFVPLRPGLVLTNPERPLHEQEARMFRDGDWQLVDAPQPVLDERDMPLHCQSSKWLAMNVLSLSPTTVVCEHHEEPLHELLDSLGFEVLTVPFRSVYEFGGSLHCATWDVRREGGCEDYFPHLRHHQAPGA
ncbi:serine/threonine protein kinase [Paraliomyxa miuraensis]|uniref:serine/threonine protein kinase n=1 Tax=Paraliomyxa miuraensis TaxID=376150 RepID=UPI002255D785|nr:serine/threonine protein kinase [Paraliomyxa miuraensis]MCX4245222.1 serine/threonine protein kinase [Paraliomyxa miuraensis]